MSNQSFGIIDLSEVLQEQMICSQAPCRIDFGGFWDAKATALVSHYVMPVTVNLALDLLLTVELLPFTSGKIKVTSTGYKTEIYDVDEVPFNTSFALVLAICHFFRVSGVHIAIDSAFPKQSGLGGSGVLAVALIHALKKALTAAGYDVDLSQKNTTQLAHDIEDGLRLSFTGLQDQAAAAFGGANLWSWHYDKPNLLFTKENIWNSEETDEASKHLLVVYTGVGHSSNKVNLMTLKSFFSGQDRKEWEIINNLTYQFADALKKWDWKSAVELMRRELNIRTTITPATLTSRMNQFITTASDCSCGARFAGAGGGGCIWAIGELPYIEMLKTHWLKLLKTIPSAKLLDISIAKVGVL